MSLWPDVIYAARAMRKSPGTTAIAILTLALGIGANTAVFSVINAALLNSAALRSLHDPSRLVMIWEKNPAMMAFIAQRMPVAPGNYREWKSESRSFSDMAPFIPFDCNVAGKASAGERPARVEAMRVGTNFFAVLGVKTASGRSFTEDEARTAGDRVVMLSGPFYRKRFGNDPNLAGKTVRVDGVERAVIGVLPESFHLPGLWEGSDQKKPQVWMPLDASSVQREQQQWARIYFVYARLRPGVPLAQARSEMNVIGKRLAQQHPAENHGCGVNVFPVSEEDAGPGMRRAMIVLQFAVGFVLLIACANVANLLLARAVGREREVAIRLALGAPRSRILRLVLTESMLLGLLGAAAGLLPAFWGLDLIASLAPHDMHAFQELRIDPIVLGFTFVLSLGTSIIFGLAPALHASRQSLNETLGRGARAIGSGPRWLRNGLVVAEVALALVLLAGAGLMIRSIRALMTVEPGFRTDHLLTLQTTVLSDTGARQTDDDKNKRFSEQLLARVEQLPGVKSASISSGLPMESVSQGNYYLEGVPRDTLLIANQTRVTETFFATMGMRMVRGRGFTRAEAEAKEANAAIVSESFARQNWPNQDALKKFVLMPNGDKPDLKLAVVGVVGDTRQMGPDGDIKPELYIPSHVFADVNLAVRTQGDPMSLKSSLEQAVWSIHPQQPIENIRSMAKVLHDWPEERRFYMTVLGAFAGLALALACIGLYGVLAYVVTLRKRELGIRMALGAGMREVLGLVVGQGVKLAAAGIVLGLGGALLLTRLMESLIFGVSAADPLTFAVVAAALAAVALLASYLPARRAAKIDPMQALRTE